MTVFVEVDYHMDRALQEFTSGVHYQSLIEAKEAYMALAGKLNEEDDEYESKMDAFNDWYVLQFKSKRAKDRVINAYLNKFKVEDEMARSLLNFNHSLFQFITPRLGKKLIVKDLLHGNKLVLPENHPHVNLLPNDIFTGRVITYQDQHYLRKGLCIFPQQVKSTLERQCKKVRKLKDPIAEEKFLLGLESLQTKWLRYKHVDAHKIFVFPEPQGSAS